MGYSQLFGLQASLPIKQVKRQKLDDIVAALKGRGFRVYRGQNFVIIDLFAAPAEGDSRRVYGIPKEIQDPDLPLLIKGAEGLFGPGHTEAVVVCGADGCKLRPFWTFELPHQVRVPNNCHALFSVLEEAVTIRAYQDQRLLVVSHEVMALRDNKLGGAWVSSSVMFDGEFSELHMRVPSLEAAAKAALHKVGLPEFEVCYALTQSDTKKAVRGFHRH